MSTAQQLIDFSSELADVAKVISAFAGDLADPDGPPGPDEIHLENLAAQIAAQSDIVGQAGIEALADDIGSAITSLNSQVGQAGAAIKRIDDVQKVLDVASAVLCAAASIAVSAGTGNWIGTASAVVTLANAIHTTLAPGTSAPAFKT